MRFVEDARLEKKNTTCIVYLVRMFKVGLRTWFLELECLGTWLLELEGVPYCYNP